MKVEVTDDFEACMAIRREVFVVEQNVPEELELDEHDETAVHLLLTSYELPIGTARLLIDGNHGKIGRVAILASQRGNGAGAVLMRGALDELRQRGVREVKLGSQVYAMGFYEKLGFVAYGPEYDDAGIPHRDMTLSL